MLESDSPFANKLFLIPSSNPGKLARCFLKGLPTKASAGTSAPVIFGVGAVVLGAEFDEEPFGAETVGVVEGETDLF
jgi:hypothetical protein